MSAIEPELQALRDNLYDMLTMVRSQMEKCREAIEKKDVALAEEVIADEKKVNIQELAIDKDCENILALYTPVATDLRMVLATLKISNDLERIGDGAKSLAKLLKKNFSKKQYKLLEDFKISEMLEVLTSMLKDMGNALRKRDTRSAMRATKKDAPINEYHKKAMKTTAALLKAHPEDFKTILSLFLMTRNLERAGDLTKNIAEEIVFQIEARVVKHKVSNK